MKQNRIFAEVLMRAPPPSSPPLRAALPTAAGAMGLTPPFSALAHSCAIPSSPLSSCSILYFARCVLKHRCHPDLLSNYGLVNASRASDTCSIYFQLPGVFFTRGTAQFRQAGTGRSLGEGGRGSV
eukprot:EG_transcript_36496